MTRRKKDAHADQPQEHDGLSSAEAKLRELKRQSDHCTKLRIDCDSKKAAASEARKQLEKSLAELQMLIDSDLESLPLFDDDEIDDDD